jgi:hypothetical protein
MSATQHVILLRLLLMVINQTLTPHLIGVPLSHFCKIY